MIKGGSDTQELDWKRFREGGKDKDKLGDKKLGGSVLSDRRRRAEAGCSCGKGGADLCDDNAPGTSGTSSLAHE
jgi:hypothetical protein